MKRNSFNVIAIISFIIAGITFLIGIIMLLPSSGFYQTESDFIEVIPFWILTGAFMSFGIGWLVLQELKRK